MALRFFTSGLKLNLSVKSVAAKSTVMFLAVSVCLLLISAAVAQFIIGTLMDERVATSIEALTTASNYFPSSALLHGRLAAIMEQQGDLPSAESHILSAVAQSPYNYSYALTLASIQESRGDYASAEQSLRAALNLAPNKAEVHWSLANLLLRNGALADSLEEFRIAASLKRSLLPGTLNLVWRASNGSIQAVKSVTTDEPADRISLARFLFNHSQPTEAAEVFNTIDRQARLASAQSAALLTAFAQSKNLLLARSLWAGTVGEDNQTPLIWNGSFELKRLDGFSQFDWSINRSDYARIAVIRGHSRTGFYSLHLEFSGRDTTRLDNEIQQFVVVKPGARYQIECYAKADRLVTPEGPRLVVSAAASGPGQWLASSEAVSAGTGDWQRLVTEFVAPATADGEVGLYISIKRRPSFSFDEPTSGSIYFDDFKLIEQISLAGKDRSSSNSRPGRGNGTL